ncbi:hypothetical protein HQ487_02680 [Candidatus Uhrbacteria bacterium]|nr:hypothetical protein [Candidatus Uhrbacteria bacterium]
MSKPLISIGELIDQSWEVFRARSTELLTISGWLLSTAILFAIALSFYPSASRLQLGGSLTSLEIMGVVIFAITSFVIAPLLSFWIYTSITKATGNHLARKTVNAKQAMKEGRLVFIPAALTSVMVILMALLAVVIGFAPAIILATIGSLANVSALIVFANILLILGIFVAVFLTIKWVVFYFLAPYITILDGVTAKVALATSRQLIQGRFWAVLIRILVPKLVFIIFGVFAMSIVAYLVGIIISASSGINFDIQLRVTTMTQTIVPIVIAVLINPLILISDVLLLKSLKQ